MVACAHYTYCQIQVAYFYYVKCWVDAVLQVQKAYVYCNIVDMICFSNSDLYVVTKLPDLYRIYKISALQDFGCLKCF